MNKYSWHIDYRGQRYYFNSMMYGIIAIFTVFAFIFSAVIASLYVVLTGLYQLGGWPAIITWLLVSITYENSSDGVKKTYAIISNEMLRVFIFIVFVTVGIISFIVHF